MAKRLLLFVVFCFVSVSISWGQCDRTYRLSVNGSDQFPSTKLDIIQNHYKIFACGILELKIINPAPDVTYKWYRNDSLLTETSSILKSFQSGVFRVEIENNDCAYKIGDLYLERIETIPINLSTHELTICDKTQSPVPLSALVDLNYSEAKFQWQKDGKDIPNETSRSMFPSSVGTYALRVSIDNCSATSLPITVKSSADNIILDYLSIDNTNATPITEDTLFLCQDNSYTFRGVQNQQNTDWYLNGKFLETNYIFTPKESGIYYTRKALTENCFWGSKPLYVSLDKKLSPIKINQDEASIYCDYKTIFFNDEKIRGNNKLTIKDALTGNIIYGTSNFENFFSIWVNSSKYIINYETESCKGETQYLDNTSKKRHISTRLGEKLGGKKVKLCHNGSVIVWVRHNVSDEVKLFRNGILIRTQAPGINSNIPFNLSESGKYHFEVISPNCTPIDTAISDTVEIEVPESIATLLTISGQACSSNVLQAKEYAGYTYSWYKNNQLIPNQSTSIIALKPDDFGNFHAVLQKDFCSVATQVVKIGEKIQGQSNVCQYSKIDLRSNITDATYLWKGPNNYTSKSFNIIIDSVGSKHAGIYVLETKQGGCTFIDSLEIKIIPKPDLSITFLNPMCANKEVLVALKGKAGRYDLHYKFHGIIYTTSSVQMAEGQETSLVNFGTLGELPAGAKKEFLQIENKGCIFPVSVPSRLSQEACQNILDFVHIKDNYCAKERISLEIRVPDNIPADTKFNLLLKHPNGYYTLGLFSGNKISIQIPGDIDSYPAFFILESTNGKYKIYSKQITVNNVLPYIFSKYGNYTKDNVIHCKGVAIKIESYNAHYQKLQWKLNGVDIPGANSPTFEAKEDGYYTLVATYNGCTEESSHVELRSGNLPKPFIASLMGNSAACQGFSVPIQEMTDFSYSEYEWKLNGRVVKRKAANEIFDAKETGYYSLTARQGNCATISDSIFIQIGYTLPNTISASTFSSKVKRDDKIFVCDKTEVRFFSTNILNYLLDSTHQAHGFDFQWKHNGVDIKGANKQEFRSSEPGVYSLQIKQGDCVVNSNKIELIQQNILPVKLINDTHGELINAKDTMYCV